MLDALLTDVSSRTMIAQAIGLVGTAGGMAWPLFRGRFGMLVAQLVPSVCFAIHYWMLGAPTGSVMNVLSGLQILAAIPLGSRPEFRLVYLLLLPVIAAAMALTWIGLPSVFAAAGTAFISLSRYQTAVVPLRLCMAVALPCWFGHNFLVGSVPGMMSDCVGMAINAWILTRMLLVQRAGADPLPAGPAREVP